MNAMPETLTQPRFVFLYTGGAKSQVLWQSHLAGYDPCPAVNRRASLTPHVRPYALKPLRRQKWTVEWQQRMAVDKVIGCATAPRWQDRNQIIEVAW